MNPYIIIAALVGGIVSHGATAYVSYGKGKKAERAIWNEANISILAASNTNLSGLLSSHENEIGRLRKIEVDAGNKTAKIETRIIERIKEIPVEKVIKIAGDCRIDYGLVRLRNDWAEGNRLSESARSKTDGDIPNNVP